MGGPHKKKKKKWISFYISTGLNDYLNASEDNINIYGAKVTFYTTTKWQ